MIGRNDVCVLDAVHISFLGWKNIIKKLRRKVIKCLKT